MNISFDERTRVLTITEEGTAVRDLLDFLIDYLPANDETTKHLASYTRHMFGEVGR